MAVRWLAYDPMFNYCRGPGYGRQWSWEHLECRCLRCGYVWAEAPASEVGKVQTPRSLKVPYCLTCNLIGPYQTITSGFPVLSSMNSLTGKDECAGCGGKYAFVTESEVNPAGCGR